MTVRHWRSEDATPRAADVRGATVVHWPGAGHQLVAAVDYCVDAGAEAIVLVSSTRVYGALPSHDMQLDERTEPAEDLDDPLLAELADADRILSARAISGDAARTRIVVLRPVHVLGSPVSPHRPTTALAAALASGRVRAAFGFDPMMQVIHRADLETAIEATTERDLHGVFNVCGPGALPLSVLSREAGTERVGGIGGALSDLAERFGLAGTAHLPQTEICYPINVSDERFRVDAGWSPTCTLRQTVDGLIGVTP